MKLIESPLNKDGINDLEKEYGNYLKITADLEKEHLVVGCELHPDGEKVLLQSDSKQDNIWGGGIDLKTKEIDTTAVMNIRPTLNNSLEILDPQRREKFIEIAKNIFHEVWN